jgi:CheY-like chemotaxis protein
MTPRDSLRSRNAPARPWVMLFVDDEPDIRESIKALIEGTIPGVTVVTASSGRAALEMLDKERIDLIMSDFKMPGMDGIEFLFQARRLHPTIPRIMFTAFQSEDLARRALVETMVSAFLSKTVAPDEMVERVLGLLKYEPASEAGAPGNRPAPQGA